MLGAYPNQNLVGISSALKHASISDDKDNADSLDEAVQNSNEDFVDNLSLEMSSHASPTKNRQSLDEHTCYKDGLIKKVWIFSMNFLYTNFYCKYLSNLRNIF